MWRQKTAGYRIYPVTWDTQTQQDSTYKLPYKCSVLRLLILRARPLLDFKACVSAADGRKVSWGTIVRQRREGRKEGKGGRKGGEGKKRKKRINSGCVQIKVAKKQGGGSTCERRQIRHARRRRINLPVVKIWALWLVRGALWLVSEGNIGLTNHICGKIWNHQSYPRECWKPLIMSTSEILSCGDWLKLSKIFPDDSSPAGIQVAVSSGESHFWQLTFSPKKNTPPSTVLTRSSFFFFCSWPIPTLSISIWVSILLTVCWKQHNNNDNGYDNTHNVMTFCKKYMHKL